MLNRCERCGKLYSTDSAVTKYCSMGCKRAVNDVHNFRVNVVYRGKERWRYTRTIEKARAFQAQAIAQGLCSMITRKVDGKYREVVEAPRPFLNG